MLLVLGLVIGLLFVAPALLLWTGRLIMANTDPRTRPRPFRLGQTEAFARSASGDAAPGSVHQSDGADTAPWFRRPMLPAFGKSETQD